MLAHKTPRVAFMFQKIVITLYYIRPNRVSPKRCAYLAISTPPTAPMAYHDMSAGNLQWMLEIESYLLDVTVDGELTGGQGTDHEETGTDTTVRALKTELLGDLDEAAGGALTRESLGLVDLGKHGVGGLGNEGGGETGNETGTEVDGSVHATGGGGLVNVVGVDGLGDLLVDHELGHGVGDPGNL